MPVSVRARAPDLKALSRDLKEAGRTDLRKELFAGLNRGTKPLRAAAKANALATLPSSGGLAALVANATMTVRGAGSAKVTIVARPKRAVGQGERDRFERQKRAAEATKDLTLKEGRVRASKLRTSSAQDLQRIDDGTVRHPTFGHGPTVTQAVKPGWFSEPMREGADAVREELLDAIEVVAHELANG